MSSLLTVTPFTMDNVRLIFEKTRNLQELCVNLGIYHLIPRDKRGDAAAAAEFCVTQRRNWRRIIWNLDGIGDTALAESIMDRAEPPAGVWCVHA